MKIGFIGLGVMGRPMAGHLIDAGAHADPQPGQAGLAGRSSTRAAPPPRRRRRSPRPPTSSS